MSLPVQVLSDCPSCRVESAVLELILPGQPAVGNCRMCGFSIEGGAVSSPGRPFRTEAEVIAALELWAEAERELLHLFVEANFRAGTPEAVAVLVLSGGRVETSFDVVAWLFRNRTTGATAIGGSIGDAAVSAVEGSEGSGGGGKPPATPPRFAPAAAPDVRRELVPDPLATTRALCSTALADGRVEAAERRVLLAACVRLGAPEPTEGDWRAWRPNELGFPPDPGGTIKAMIQVALADRVPDEGEARVIREFARTWRVTLTEPTLPPVTLPQKAAAAWLGLFAR
jgi:hypothetical protein